MSRMSMAVMIAAFIIMFSALVAATAVYYETDELVDIKVPCDDDGQPCPATTVCNMTVLYQNSSVLLKDGIMTNQGSFHNYSLGYLLTRGTYRTIVFCCDGADCGTSTFEFEVREPLSPFNPNVEDRNFIVLAIFLFVGFASSLILFVFSRNVYALIAAGVFGLLLLPTAFYLNVWVGFVCMGAVAVAGGLMIERSR